MSAGSPVGGRTAAAHQDAAGSEGTGAATMAAGPEEPSRGAIVDPQTRRSLRLATVQFVHLESVKMISRKIMRANPGHFW